MKSLTAAQPADPKSLRLPWAALLLLTLLPGVAAAQSPTSGSTAAGLAPGSPAGSFALSGFESVSPYSGGLSFRLPLLTVGGRGGATHTVTLPVEQKWRIVRTMDSAQQEHYVPDANWWSGYEPGYGPGVLQGRQAGDNIQQCAYVPYDSHYTQTLTRLTFTAPDGTEYDLRDTITGGSPATVPTPGPNCQVTNANRGRVFVTADGSAATFISDADIYDASAVVNGGGDGLIYPSGYLLLRDGTRYRVNGGLVVWKRDRNGNLISFAYDPYGRVATITDSLGRQATVSYASAGTPYDQINFKGFGGADRTVRVWYASLGSALRTGRPGDSSSPKTYRELFPQLFDASPYTTYNPQVVSGVELPDGRRYEFRYNVYGEPARVALPTGGAFEYDYAAGVVGELSYNYMTGGVAEASSGVTGGTQVYRRVVTRRIYEGGTAAEESRTTFSRPESYNAGSMLYENAGHVTVDQLDAGGQLLARTRHYYHGSAHNSLFKGALDYTGCVEGREYKTESYGADGATLLRKIELSWQPGTPLAANPVLCANARAAGVTTTLADTNQVSKQTFSYDEYNNLTDVYEYDFCATPGTPGALVRRTHTDYVTTNTAAGVSYDYACNPSTTCGNAAVTAGVIHLRDLPRRQWVSADAAGTNKVIMTDYAYDQSGLTDRAGITGLCVSFTGGQCSSADAAGYITRGNLTGVTRYADAAAGTGAVTATSAYDVAGNVVSTTDPRGHTSHVSYADAFCNGSACGGTFTPNTYAFATGTTTPVPDTSAAQGHPAGTFGSTSALTTSAVYDFYTGLTTAKTDANNQTTSLQYRDVLGRVTAVIRPSGGGRTDFIYDDTVGNLHVRLLTDLDPGRRTEAKQFFDGLGRGYRKAVYEGYDASKPWITVDTQYDALGRAEKVTMPFRAAEGVTPFSAGTTDKWTETAYDALGRVLSVRTKPDTATMKKAYKGNLVQVTDQAGKSRRSEADALGRLKEVVEFTRALADPTVVENPLPTDYVTGYSYDTQGNLRKVNQGGQLRFFMYDSLGQLLRVKNPEQGNFAADADFPALTDSTSGTSNSQWSAGYVYDPNGNVLKRKDARNITATYGYDALNRVTTVRYAGESGPATPGVNRYYDHTTLGLGRPWKSETVGGSLTAIDEYDAVGRPKQQTQKFWAGAAWGPAYTTQVSYNLAGAMTSLAYPSGHTVAYHYDIAGRLADHGGQPAFKGTLGDGVERSYASQVTYDELGGMSQERFGTDTPVYNKRFYNSRAQLAEIRVSTHSITSTDPQLKTNWDRGAIINHYSNAPGAWGATGGGPDNNGNLLRHSVYVPTDGQGGFWNANQFYEYDSLNRLDRASEEQGGVTRWAQEFDYDRWGNRTIDAAGTWDTSQTNWRVNETQFDVGDLANSNRLYAPGDLSRPEAERMMRYDAAGNLTKDTYTGGGARAYDAENRMTSAVFLAGQTQTAYYSYDADGRRVKRSAGAAGEVWQVYGAGGELLAEYGPNASPSQPRKEYGYRSGQLLVTAEAAAPAPKLPVSAVTASLAWGSFTPEKGADGDPSTSWIAGGGAPQWLQLDLGQASSLSKVRLLVNQDPAGNTTHQVWGGSSPDSLTLLGTLSGFTQSGQWLELQAAAQGVRYVRVTTTGSPSWVAWSEVEVYGGGAASVTPSVQWIVSDQLGTPRMVLDKTGSLAGVKRHDYLPFGEEMACDTAGGTTGRSTANGYAADFVRQKFTGKERDDETGLDYFLARYYSNPHGRFTSTDPFGPWAMGEREKLAFLSEPQQWNRYAYVTNNPLRYVDPDGMVRFDSSVSPEQQAAILNALNNILKNPKATKDQKAIANFLLNNDVLVSVEKNPARLSGARADFTGDEDGYAPTQKAIDAGPLTLSQAAGLVSITIMESQIKSGTVGTTALEGILVHEGQHAYDLARVAQGLSDPSGPNAGFDPTQFTFERTAYVAQAEYQLTSFVGMQQGLSSGLLERIPRQGRPPDIGVSEKGIRKILANDRLHGGGGYNVTEHEPGQTQSQRTGLRPRKP